MPRCGSSVKEAMRTGFKGTNCLIGSEDWGSAAELNLTGYRRAERPAAANRLG